MASGHHHEHRHHAPHVTAATPTISLLRLSAGQRLVGGAVLSAAVWALVILTIR
jgi:hypothetical protein